MRVCVITGWRRWEDPDPVHEVLRGADLVIVGCCKTGADMIAREFCAENGIRCAVFRANFHLPFRTQREKLARGPARNLRMAQAARRGVEAGHEVDCYGFPKPGTNFDNPKMRGGTVDCIRKLRQQGLPVWVEGILVPPFGPAACVLHHTGGA